MSAHLGFAFRFSVRSAFARPSGRVSGPAGRPDGWLASLRGVLRTVETRQHLAGLDEHMLRDIGMTRRDALAELRRAPWDIAPGSHG